MNHLTIATSTGLVWLILIAHLSAGLTALVSGTVALAVRKGGQLHKKSGMIFSCAMIALGLLASVLYTIEGQSVAGGLFPVYLVFTALTTVKPLPYARREADIGLMLLAFTMAALTYMNGVAAWKARGPVLKGVPAGMGFFLATIILLAAIGDVRMIVEGGITGARRLARHLWRMCFGLFVATGSFFLGQMKFIPAPIRIVPVLFVLALAPLVILLYWMWRVRVRRRIGGLILRNDSPVAVRIPTGQVS